LTTTKPTKHWRKQSSVLLPSAPQYYQSKGQSDPNLDLKKEDEGNKDDEYYNSQAQGVMEAIFSIAKKADQVFDSIIKTETPQASETPEPSEPSETDEPTKNQPEA
jgi:hypothetical protein